MFTNLGYVSTKALRVALVVALGATLAALTAVALVVVSPAARAVDGNCQTSGSEVVCTFGTPGASIWTVPEGVTQATYAVSGAQGGSGGGLTDSGGQGGLGGEAKATFSNLQPSSQLLVNVGGSNVGPDGGGGFAPGGTPRGGAGGGASDVSFDFNNDGFFGWTERIIVGGGGGGGGGGAAGSPCRSGSDGGDGGSGGGLSGNGGNSSGSGEARGGGGGTQAGGGAGGIGFNHAGDGLNGFFGGGGKGGSGSSCGAGGGGGGDGYYGGGGGGGFETHDAPLTAIPGGGGGGGGSGYVQPLGTDVQFRSGVQSGDGQVTITYTLPTVSPDLLITDTTVTEGNSGTSQADFTVSLSEPSTQQVTVAYATEDGTASAGEDYVGATSGSTLTFAPGDTSKAVSVEVDGDTVYEPDETFFVNLSNPANATISDEKGIGTITNDDQPPGTTAPMVSTTSPSEPNGTMGKADLVAATFSEEVKGVSEQTFFLKRYTLSKNGRETYVPVTAKVTTPNDITAVLNPTKDLARGTYQATITNGVTDKAGNALVPKTWSFTVVR
jgi:hypothetical protein